VGLATPSWATWSRQSTPARWSAPARAHQASREAALRSGSASRLDRALRADPLHRLCNARARRPSSWSWLLPRRARRLRVETATSVAGPTRRCCTRSLRSTGLRFSSEPSKPGDCLTSSSRNSRRTCAAACSSTVSPTSLAGNVASRWSWRSPAGVEGFARRASAGACPMSLRISWTRCSQKYPCDSGRCRGGYATRWATTDSCVPTCSMRSSSRCAARFDDALGEDRQQARRDRTSARRPWPRRPSAAAPADRGASL